MGSKALLLMTLEPVQAQHEPYYFIPKKHKRLKEEAISPFNNLDSNK